jgi:hypothetical protein
VGTGASRVVVYWPKTTVFSFFSRRERISVPVKSGGRLYVVSSLGGCEGGGCASRVSPSVTLGEVVSDFLDERCELIVYPPVKISSSCGSKPMSVNVAIWFLRPIVGYVVAVETETPDIKVKVIVSKGSR